MPDIMRWLNFRWFWLRRKLHYIGWHDKMCRSYKAFPVKENRPRCEATGRFCRPSKVQRKYRNLSPTARMLIHGK